MCCFTLEARVSDTSIFARGVDDRQLVVYSMRYAAESDLAMVLPIPVPPRSPEDALRFISLEECPDFFAHLRDGFPGFTGDLGATLSADVETLAVHRTLEVHSVGAYEASFVPQPADFGRLDERFRLPAELWYGLRDYRDWGFAVFKLRENAALTEVHPMAFEFPRRDAARLFFPTLHIHHRRYEERAHFDHTLYCQATPALNYHLGEWEDSDRAAGRFLRCKAAEPLFDLAAPCWRAEIQGLRENRDTWVGRGEKLPATT